MRALLVVAHGSRLATSNAEVEELVARLASRVAPHFDRVSAAFLEIATPSISDAIDDFAAQGVLAITILPYFLVAGRHVTQDIPRLIEQKRQQYPMVNIGMSRHIGDAPQMLELLVRATQS